MIACPHLPPCPGCPRLGELDVAAPARDALRALCEEAALGELRVVRGEATGFRHRARLAVRGRARSPKIGIFEAGTHRIVDIPRCLVHHPLVNEVAQELRRAIVATGAPPYSDEAHQGLVRYVQIVVERRSRSAQVVLVTNATSSETSEPLADDLTRRLGGRLHSLHWNGNAGRTNTILGPLFRSLRGPAAVEEHIGGARVFFPPGAFGQSHLGLADRVVALVHSWVPDGARVLELYAGVGPIGLGLVHRSAHVLFNEVSNDSIAGLQMGMAALGDALEGRAAISAGPASGAVAAAGTSDVVIADPPRKGLDPEVRDALAARPPETFVYVACGLEAFLEDARALVASGSLSLSELVAFDLFPYTEHVEVAARFTRIAACRDDSRKQ